MSELNGILLLDKPLGITSNAALQQVKRAMKVRKAGHTGSLDPLATGVLPICIGESTKFSQFLLNADKSYEVVMRLGVTTTTGDAEGEVVEERMVPSVSQEQLDVWLKAFLGPQQQIPPMFSAIKYQGVPLYVRARRGEVIERKPRDIHIIELSGECLPESHIRLQVRCSKGTYIRSLVFDLGEIIGCGATVTALRRTQVGTCLPERLWTMPQLQELSSLSDFASCLWSVSDLLPEWPLVVLQSSEAGCIQNGQSVLLEHPSAPGLARIVTPEQHFIGVGQICDKGILHPKRLCRA